MERLTEKQVKEIEEQPDVTTPVDSPPGLQQRPLPKAVRSFLPLPGAALRLTRDFSLCLA